MYICGQTASPFEHTHKLKNVCTEIRLFFFAVVMFLGWKLLYVVPVYFKMTALKKMWWIWQAMTITGSEFSNYMWSQTINAEEWKQSVFFYGTFYTNNFHQSKRANHKTGEVQQLRSWRRKGNFCHACALSRAWTDTNLTCAKFVNLRLLLCYILNLVDWKHLWLLTCKKVVFSLMMKSLKQI